MVQPTVEVEVKRVQRALREVDVDFPKQLRRDLKTDVAEPVAKDIQSEVPYGPGHDGTHWRDEIRAGATQTTAYIQWGRKLPYPGWVEFGGDIVQPNRGVTISRTRKADGRYVYPTIERNRGRITDTAQKTLQSVARRAGIPVT